MQQQWLEALIIPLKGFLLEALLVGKHLQPSSRVGQVISSTGLPWMQERHMHRQASVKLCDIQYTQHYWGFTGDLRCIAALLGAGLASCKAVNCSCCSLRL